MFGSVAQCRRGPCWRKLLSIHLAATQRQGHGKRHLLRWVARCLGWSRPGWYTSRSVMWCCQIWTGGIPSSRSPRLLSAGRAVVLVAARSEASMVPCMWRCRRICVVLPCWLVLVELRWQRPSRGQVEPHGRCMSCRRRLLSWPWFYTWCCWMPSCALLPHSSGWWGSCHVHPPSCQRLPCCRCCWLCLGSARVSDPCATGRHPETSWDGRASVGSLIVAAAEDLTDHSWGTLRWTGKPCDLMTRPDFRLPPYWTKNIEIGVWLVMAMAIELRRAIGARRTRGVVCRYRHSSNTCRRGCWKLSAVAIPCRGAWTSTHAWRLVWTGT